MSTPAATSPSSPFFHGPSSAEWTAAHEALKADDALWRAMAFDGVQHDGRGGLVENRRCPHCESTLSRPISPEQAREVCQHQAVVHALSAEAIVDAGKVSAKPPRGFAAMPPEQQRAIARLGGLKAHEDGRAHRFTSEQARVAGRKGGEVVSVDKEYMAKIGRRGGKARGAKYRR